MMLRPLGVSRPASARGVLPAAAALLGALPALAHDPGLSRLALVIEDRSVTATLSIAAEHRSVMEKAAGLSWALEALEVIVDGEAAPAERTGSGAPEGHTLEVELRFPAREPHRVHVRSRMLAWLPSGHRQVALAMRADGARLSAAVLSRGADRLECALAEPAAIARPGFHDFLGLGARHILEGPDHLLFLLALFLGRRSLLDGLKVITAFTAAHSVTLALSALELASLPPTVVEPLIAASIIHAGAANVAGRGGGVGAGLAFAFGLVHGLGLSYALRDAGLGSGWAAALALLGFNLGVELAQLAIAVLVLPWVIRLVPHGVFSRRLAPVISGVIILCGAWWLFERTVLS